MKMLCTVKLSPHRYKTPEGYLYCKDAIIARTGKQTYMKSEIIEGSDSDEYIEVDRKPEQVFDEKTMASFENAPLTIEHPSVSVSPENYKELSVGHVQNIRRGKFEGQDVLFADILVNDIEAIELIESGDMTELSCGYDCDITSGDNPEQINIRGNHVALCEQGRAGIARIQDAKKAKINTSELDGIINYHYRTDQANDLDMSKFISRLLVEYVPNEISRQPTADEKEYIKAKAKAIMSDSWGVKPITVDSASKGMLIQEFGKQGKQYKIAKIAGNVIYAESLVDGRTVLFKKDEENVEWAPITKGEVKDSAGDNFEELRQIVENISDHFDSEYAVVKDYRNEKKREWKNRVIVDEVERKTGLKFKFLNHEDKFGGSDSEGSWYYPTYYYSSGDYILEIRYSGGYYQAIGVELHKKSDVMDSGREKFVIEVEMNPKDLKIYSETWDTLKFKPSKNGKTSVSGDEDEIEEFLKDFVGQWGKIGQIMSEGMHVADSDGKRYRVTTFPLSRQRYFIMGDNLSLEEAKEAFNQAVKRISSSNKSSQFSGTIYIYLDEDTEFFNDNVIMSAMVGPDGKASVSKRLMGDKSVKDRTLKPEEYDAIDISNAVSSNGYLWAKDKSESELLTKAYWSADNGKTWNSCGLYPKQPDRSSRGNRTQAGKWMFAATNAKGQRKTIGRNILTWYVNNGGGSVDPSLEIDHINGDYTDDKLSNLRRVTHSENVKYEQERRKAKGKDHELWYASSDPMVFHHKNGNDYEVADRTFSQMAKCLASYGCKLVRKNPKGKEEFEYIPGTQFLSSMNGNIYAKFRDEAGAIRTLMCSDYYDYIKEIDAKAGIGDSWGISLQGEGNGDWLGEGDKPVSDRSKAKKFKSQGEAEEYCKAHCKGMAVKLKDSFDPEGEIPNIEKLLKGIKHSKPSESWGSLTVDFPDKKSLKKAGDILWKHYDIELFNQDGDLYISIYDKNEDVREGGGPNDPFDDEGETIWLGDAQEGYMGIDLLRGIQSKEFKEYLRDRGLYFEPSDNGDYVHFEVKGADKFVKQRAEDIREHHKKFADSFSRKFYVKAIKALEDQLKKLDKKTTLDENQFEFEKQKDKMRASIKAQIAEYKKKIDGERIGFAG